MLSTFEMNVGHGIYGAAGKAAPLLEMLGQGDGIKVCAQWFSRARRRNPDAERNLTACAVAAAMVKMAMHNYADLGATDDKAADLIAFIFERGVNMTAPPTETGAK